MSIAGFDKVWQPVCRSRSPRLRCAPDGRPVDWEAKGVGWVRQTKWAAPELPAVATRMVLKETRAGFVYVRDEVATEWPLTVMVNGAELVTLVCTPTHLEELVVGFLHSEGVVRQPEEILDLAFGADVDRVDVLVARAVEELRESLFTRRYITSCCGKGRASVYFANDAELVRPVEADVHLRPDQCRALIRRLQEGSEVFQRTGGVHNACLASPDEVLVARCDIGRHNALDKLYGYALLHGLPVADKVIAFSGRVSSEVLTKAAKIGVSVVLSKSAPTELALALADELNLTVVGFVRGDGMNVYTHPERIDRA
jgi:FdhD protein